MSLESALYFLKSVKSIPGYMLSEYSRAIVDNVEEAVTEIQLAKANLKDATTDYVRDKNQETQAALDAAIDDTAAAIKELSFVLDSYKIKLLPDRHREDIYDLQDVLEGVLVKNVKPGVLKELLLTLEDYMSLVTNSAINSSAFWEKAVLLSNLRKNFVVVKEERDEEDFTD